MSVSRQQQDHKGHDLQSSCQHVEAEDQFGEDGQTAIVPDRAHGAIGGTDVVEAGDH